MRRSLRFLPILVAAIAIGWVYLTSETFVNPETGRKAHVGLSDSQEQQLGLQSFHCACDLNVPSECFNRTPYRLR